MQKPPYLMLFMILVLLLSGCGVRIQPGLPPGTVDSAPAAPPATPIEKVVSLVPQAEVTPPVMPSATLPPPFIDAAAQETAVANLRELLNAPQLALAVKGLERSPNASNHMSALLIDPQGNRYYVNLETLRPLEFTQEWPAGGALGSPISLDEQRAIAEKLASAQSPRFDVLRERLAYSEGVKGELSFFRWEMPDTDVGNMPALLQIGLRQDGTLFSFINSLDFLP